MQVYRMLEHALGYLDGHRDRRVKSLVRNNITAKLVKSHIVTPNGLSIARTFIALSIIGFLGRYVYQGHSLNLAASTRLYLFAAMAIASLTDLFDGPLAREYAHFISHHARIVGINLDRHADKLLTLPILAIYCMVIHEPVTKWLIGLTVAGDILATALAMLAKWVGNPIPSNGFGKAKMVTLCMAIFWLFLAYPHNTVIFQLITCSSLTLGTVSLATNIQVFARSFRSVRAEVNTNGPVRREAE